MWRLLGPNLTESGIITHTGISIGSMGSSNKKFRKLIQQPQNSNVSTNAVYSTTSYSQGLPTAEKIVDTINKKKIFSIRGPHPEFTRIILRIELLRRGWLEKRIVNAKSQKETLLKNATANLVWTSNPYEKKYSYGTDNPYYSRLPLRPHTTNFSSKVGLSNLHSKLHWFQDNTKSETNLIMPRSYVLNDDADKQAFVSDFRLTTCTTFLLEILFLDPKTVITTALGLNKQIFVDFALHVVKCAINEKKDLSIDSPIDVRPPLDSEMFEIYHKEFTRILKDGRGISVPSARAAETLIANIYRTVEEAIQYFPHITTDGFKNLWILKPDKFGCGAGISLHNSESSVLQYCGQNPNTLYIVQKYVEYPLLIYNTKFDIRQYFLIVMDDKWMRVWMYKNCYLKFSGQEFNFTNLSRSIHLTNYTIQRKFKNDATRDKKLPAHNMWVLGEFKKYLKTIGQADKWETQIYPELVDGIRSVIEGTFEGIEFAQNSFQLFGADVMVTHDYHPVLLEINAAPDLSPSTISTKAVCGAVIRDILKVVIDYPLNKNCSTGDFECIFQFNMQDYCAKSGLPKMEITGTPCALFNPIISKKLQKMIRKSHSSTNSSSEWKTSGQRKVLRPRKRSRKRSKESYRKSLPHLSKMSNKVGRGRSIANNSILLRNTAKSECSYFITPTVTSSNLRQYMQEN